VLLPFHSRNQMNIKGRPKRLGGSAFMSESTVEKSHTVISLRPVVTDAPVDERLASMIDVLHEHLKLVRDGQLRSLALVSVSADGSAIGTQWSCVHADLATLIGKLTVLAHDMMAARR